MVVGRRGSEVGAEYWGWVGADEPDKEAWAAGPVTRETNGSIEEVILLGVEVVKRRPDVSAFEGEGSG